MKLKAPLARRAAVPRERHVLVMRLLAAVVILGGATTAVVLRLALGDEAEGLTRPKQPALFQGTSGELALGARNVFGVAHNAGDSVEASVQALAVGARVVEIDVVASQGELFVSHDRPLPLLGGALQAPRLEQIWGVAAGADAVVLDLKQSSPFSSSRSSSSSKPIVAPPSSSLPQARWRFASFGTRPLGRDAS
jgi:hypothetical protein